MLTMLGSPRRCCDGLTRREALQASFLPLLGGAGLTQAGTIARIGRAKSVIVLYLLGGAGTQDMYDLKPNAPKEVRGEFQPIPTTVPGIQVCEHLPRLTRWMKHVSLIRSVTHQAGCHNPLPSYTGWEVPPPDIISTRDTYPPSMGSVYSYLRGDSTDMPNYVYMPCPLGWGQAIRRPGPYAGFLGQRHDAMYTTCKPYLDPGQTDGPGRPAICRGVPFIPDSVLNAEVTLDRLDSRRTLLQQMDAHTRQADAAPAAAAFDRSRRRAFDLLTSRSVRDAFDLDREPIKTRDRYGRTLFGESTLIARRLVESGVPFINVTWDIFWDRFKINYDGWDTHTRNFAIMKDYNLPYFDQAFDALMTDLHDRGLLDETLILVTSEMGRTPKINGNTGRDHWTFCYGNLLAGAGIQGGSVYGASDAQAAYVKDRPVRPADVCATVFHCLGIDPESMIPDRSGRPMPIANGGHVIREIVS